ncbi:aminoacyl-tRNA hydrolase [Patescibacteria group bacterium]|nr:aminoacyl-tRNA hydrolase [Patescibacteria group bacterium]MBU4481307.1 aminoacyl-tRNA hydrolase [Patescibacteria group bacterium]
MFLIVGLGNPGKKFEQTRHNIGFRAIDKIAANFPPPFIQKRAGFNAQISNGEIAGTKVILAKPQTFMNLSGKAVKILMSNVKCPAPKGRGSPNAVERQMSNILVVHDDIDLPLGKIKISVGRSSAGHKGVQSIIDELGTKNFIRFRIGICPKTGKPKNAESFVLKKFSCDEGKIVNEVIEKTCEAIEFYLGEGLEKSMTKYNV